MVSILPVEEITVEVADGTYTGTGNRNLDFNGKAITVKSANGPEKVIIDCEHNGRGFCFDSFGGGSESKVVGFTVMNGRAVHGGAIYIYQVVSYHNRLHYKK